MLRAAHGVRPSLLLCALIAAVSSASAPQSPDYTARVTASYEKVRSAALAVLSARGWQIQESKKQAGLISTDWSSVQGKYYLGCGKLSNASVVEDEQARLTVHLKKRGKRVEVTVRAQYRQSRRTGTSTRWVDCTSRGQMERAVNDEIIAASGGTF